MMSSLLKSGSRLAGKVAIVTGSCSLPKPNFEIKNADKIGGGSGYGAGIARRFAQEGAKVLITDINEQGGKDVAKEASDAMSFFKADVAKQGDWRKLMDTAESRYGKIDCLVNNAGTTYKNKVCSSLVSKVGHVH